MRRVCAHMVVLLLATAIPLAADEVVLKDGTRIVGEVLELADLKLKIKTVFAKDVEVDWLQVATLSTDKPAVVVLKDDTRFQGPVQRGNEGEINVRSEAFANPVPVQLASIAAINPVAKPTRTFKGFVAIGASVLDGNTQTKSFAGNGEFEMRSDQDRFTLRAATNYAEDSDGLTARNSRANVKYDFFFTKRFYVFAGALFEGDEFQDLKLRTALSAGPGYQFIDIGDFDRPWLHELQLSAEAGLSYFDEDFEDSPDNNYIAARWSVKVDWPIVPKKIVLFHVHEGFPGLENAEDIYITTEQGVRFSIIENFFAAAQVNWRWDNTPASGRERDDTTYLLSVGYNFSLAR